MTPTRSQLDAALPRVPSGIGAMAGDLTEPDEPGSDRAVALDWLCDLVGKATDQNTEDDIQATIEWLRSLRQSRDSATESPESDENAEQVPVDPGNNTGAHSGSVWPPPAKGTHESDLDYAGPEQYPIVAGQIKDKDLEASWKDEVREWHIAWKWSRTPEHPPAPGITYYSPRTYTDDGGFVVKEFN